MRIATAGLVCSFARVVTVKRAFDMKTDSTAPKRITIRLLNDAEQREAQAHIVR